MPKSSASAERLTATVGDLQLEADPGDPEDIGEMAAGLILACLDRTAAVARLVATLNRAGIKVQLTELPTGPMTKTNTHPPGYWLDRTKSEEPKPA